MECENFPVGQSNTGLFYIQRLYSPNVDTHTCVSIEWRSSNVTLQASVKCRE